MAILRVLVVSALVLSLSGCAGSTAAPDSKEVTVLKAQVQQLAQQVEILNSQVELHTSQITIANTRLAAVHNWTQAQFDPTDSAFEPLEAFSGVGSFAVSVKDVQQFGDGVRVKLDLGNLTAATFVGAHLTLKYGARAPEVNDKDWAADYGKWTASLKEHAVDLTDTLRPASWNPVSVVLPQLDSRNFGYLEVGISTSTISLSR